jgi:serine/threonine protein phosphatase PrpC
MVSPVKLQSVLEGQGDLTEKVESLREMVFRRGAEDNVTILLFEIGNAAE